MGVESRDFTAVAKVSMSELKRLLHNLHAYKPKAGFRCRQIGGMWMKDHLEISSVLEDSVVFYDDKNSQYVMVPFRNIVQFDLDEKFQNYQPHYHYDVDPSNESDLSIS